MRASGLIRWDGNPEWVAAVAVRADGAPAKLGHVDEGAEGEVLVDVVDEESAGRAQPLPCMVDLEAGVPPCVEAVVHEEVDRAEICE